jgi:single-strand DNA-binding protein
MPNLNCVHLIGLLTRDPDTRHTQTGTAIAEITLAINRMFKNDAGEKREEATFVDVTFFGRSAEIVQQYCKKGDALFVDGRLHLDQWDDRQTGQKRTKLKVVGEKLQLLTGRPKGPASAQKPTPPVPQAQRPASARDPDLDAEPSENDIPFSQ